MHKAAMSAIVVVSLGMGLPYALNEQWLGFLACILTGALWAYPSPYFAGPRSTVSLLLLAVFGSFGVFLGQSQLWLLTSLVILLIAWDLDHYTRIFQEFDKNQAGGQKSTELFTSHLKQLGLIAGSGWILGVVALNIRIQISFSVALFVTLLMVLSLRHVARNLTQG